MKHTLFTTVDCFSSIPFIIYPVIVLSIFWACRTIYYYFPHAISYYANTPWNIFISIFGYLTYQLMHVVSSVEIQTLFHMSPNQLPHTLTFLTLLLSTPIWLLIISIGVKTVTLYWSHRDRKLNFGMQLALSTLSIICITIGYQFIIKLDGSQELIRKMATYVDYVDKRSMPSLLAPNRNFDGFLIIDSQTVSVYRKEHGKVQFETLTTAV